MLEKFRTLSTLSTLAIALMMACAAPSMAQKAPADPARMAAAKELMTAAGGKETAIKAMNQMKDAMIKQLRVAKPAEVASVEGLLNKLLAPDHPRVVTYLNEVEQGALDFYAERFTVDELKAITQFQMSPVGKKFRDLTPELGTVMAGPFIRFQQGMMVEMQQALGGMAGRGGMAPAGAPPKR